MDRPRLNNDVLLHIMSCIGFADFPTLSALMETSHLWNHAGAKYLLRLPVRIRKPQQLESFVQFMMRDGDYRLTLLRTLILATSPSSMGYALTSLFRRLAARGNLSSLQLTYAEATLRLHPGLPHAIAALSTLKSLCMFDTGPRARNLLAHLQSELVFANLRLPLGYRRIHDGNAENAEDVGGLDVDGDNLLSLLHRSRKSLRELHLPCASSYSTSPTDVFPGVTSLTLSVTHIDEPYTGHFARTFPNLVELDTCQFNLEGRAPLGITEFHAQHLRNLQNQQEIATWDDLHSFDGTLAELFTLGIICPVTWMKLSTEDSDPDYEPWMVMVVLHYTRPVHLELRLWKASWFLNEDFLGIFDGAGVQCLETLSIIVTTDVDDGGLDALKILESIRGQIVTKLRSLKVFRLTFEFTKFYEDHRLIPPPPTILELDMQDTDLHEFAERLIRASAAVSGSLESVSVGLSRTGERTEAGTPAKDFIAAYCEELSVGDEDDQKAWKDAWRFG